MNGRKSARSRQPVERHSREPSAKNSARTQSQPARPTQAEAFEDMAGLPPRNQSGNKKHFLRQSAFEPNPGLYQWLSRQVRDVQERFVATPQPGRRSPIPLQPKPHESIWSARAQTIPAALELCPFALQIHAGICHVAQPDITKTADWRPAPEPARNCKEDRSIGVILNWAPATGPSGSYN